MMLISVVVPLFNKKDYIRRAIDSVLNQTYSNFELIVVNDGSTDGCADIVRSIGDSRIQLFSQPNSGVSKARNIGVMHANAEWVAFLDADDEYKPDFLKYAVKFLEQHEQDNLSMVGMNYYIGEQISNTKNESGVYNYFELFRNQRTPNNSSTTVVHKQKFWEVNGFPEGIRHFEDWITWFKLAFIGNFGYISTPLGIYHSVQGSASKSTRASDFFNDAVLLVQIIAEYALRYHLSPGFKKKVWRCMNEFSINIAAMIAVDGNKKVALKMLSSVGIRYFLINPVGHIRILLLHLILPVQVKKVYRSIKKSNSHLVEI